VRTRQLIDQVADIVGAAHDPKRLAELAVEIVMSLSHAQRGAVFAVEAEGLVLCAGMGLDQQVLDATNTAWTRDRAQLTKGHAVVRDNEPLRAGCASAVLPLKQDDRLAAILYLDGPQAAFLPAVKEGRVLESTKVVLRALERGAFPAAARPVPKEWEQYLAETPAEQVARAQLIALLDRNEWNIARVARLMRVTRRTVYLRLERYNVERKKIRKTPERAAARA
jgi:transcriptional regulator with GAF, ATPase, and Fis domain